MEFEGAIDDWASMVFRYAIRDAKPPKQLTKEQYGRENILINRCQYGDGTVIFRVRNRKRLEGINDYGWGYLEMAPGFITAETAQNFARKLIDAIYTQQFISIETLPVEL